MSKEEALECIGKGWRPLVSKLWDDLTALGWSGEILQVKEKFGGLRFYAHGVPEGGMDLIRAAENESMRTCEDCGKPGVTGSWGKFWILTLCPEHGEKRRNDPFLP